MGKTSTKEREKQVLRSTYPRCISSPLPWSLRTASSLNLKFDSLFQTSVKTTVNSLYSEFDLRTEDNPFWNVPRIWCRKPSITALVCMPESLIALLKSRAIRLYISEKLAGNSCVLPGFSLRISRSNPQKNQRRTPRNFGLSEQLEPFDLSSRNLSRNLRLMVNFAVRFSPAQPYPSVLLFSLFALLFTSPNEHEG